MEHAIFGPAFVAGGVLNGFPLSGPITASFGSTSIPEHAGGHTGVDIGAASGTAVAAPAPGFILEAGASGGVFGTCVVMRHPGGTVSLFAHLGDVAVAPGMRVRRGALLGSVRMTGLTTGPHLHWGLGEGGSPMVRGPHLRDPLACLSASAGAFERERLLRAVASSLLGGLQAAGALFETHATEDFEGYAEGSPERLILAIQKAADPFIARYGSWNDGT